MYNFNKLVLLINFTFLTSLAVGQVINKNSGDDSGTEREKGVQPVFRIEVLEDHTIKVYDMQGNLVDSTLIQKMKNEKEILQNTNETDQPSKSFDEIKKGPDLKEEKTKEIKNEEGLSSPGYNEMQKGPDLKEEKTKEIKNEEGLSSPGYNEMQKGSDLKEERRR